MAYPPRKLDECYYSILGLARSASPSAIRSAYRELAMIWHPDKCRSEDLAAKGKLKFQEIQEAYTEKEKRKKRLLSVLSDVQKKMLYDNGLYDPNDDEEDIEGLSSLMNEISNTVAEMKAAEENGGKAYSFEEYQQLFKELFGTDDKMAHLRDRAAVSAAHFSHKPTKFSYPSKQFSHQPTNFSHPTAQFSHQLPTERRTLATNHPPTHVKTASSNYNKRDRRVYERSLPSDIPGNDSLYESFDTGHASTNTAKKKKRSMEQEGSHL